MRRAKEKKGSKGWRAKPATQTRGIDVLIGDEEQFGKLKKEGKERNMEWDPQPSYPGVLSLSEHFNHKTKVMLLFFLCIFFSNVIRVKCNIM